MNWASGSLTTVNTKCTILLHSLTCAVSDPHWGTPRTTAGAYSTVTVGSELSGSALPGGFGPGLQTSPTLCCRTTRSAGNLQQLQLSRLFVTSYLDEKFALWVTQVGTSLWLSVAAVAFSNHVITASALPSLYFNLREAMTSASTRSAEVLDPQQAVVRPHESVW